MIIKQIKTPYRFLILFKSFALIFFYTNTNGIKTGIALKFRVRRKFASTDRWREIKLWFETQSNGVLRIFRIELSTHLGKFQHHGRILKTKKYIRFKVCI